MAASKSFSNVISYELTRKIAGGGMGTDPKLYPYGEVCNPTNEKPGLRLGSLPSTLPGTHKAATVSELVGHHQKARLS